MALAGLLVSCSITPKSAPTPAIEFPTAKDSAGAAVSMETNRASIYDRAGVRFERADFFKPSNPVEGDLGFTLAPLFLQEVVRFPAHAGFRPAIRAP